MQIVTESLGEDTKAVLHGFLQTPDEALPEQNYPAIIIVPGGSYTHIPEAQAEKLALAFTSLGYQSFYLRYSFVDEKSPLHPAPVVELAQSVALIRQHADDWAIDPQRLALAGFSVGGHIVALYNDTWHQDWLTDQLGVSAEALEPQATILGYPVISPKLGFPTDEQTLATWSDQPEQLAANEYVSDKNAPTFIWATADDPLVPASNSLAYATALAAHNVDYELHLFHHGPHGLALANHLTAWKRDANQPHVARWLQLADEWLNETL